MSCLHSFLEVDVSCVLLGDDALGALHVAVVLHLLAWGEGEWAKKELRESGKERAKVKEGGKEERKKRQRQREE